MVRSKTLYCSSRFPWRREIISSKFIDNLDTRPQKGSPALHYSIEVENKWNYPSTHTPSPYACMECTGKFYLYLFSIKPKVRNFE